MIIVSGLLILKPGRGVVASRELKRAQKTEATRLQVAFEKKTEEKERTTRSLVASRDHRHVQAVVPVGDSPLEYMHEYIEVSSVSKIDRLKLGFAQEVANEYHDYQLEHRLNEFGRAGWRVINMEPDWHWAKINVSMSMAITRPISVVGWYLTFSRSSTQPFDGNHSATENDQGETDIG